MSWSVTINDLSTYPGFDTAVIEQMLTQHPDYPADMGLALGIARKMGLASCVLTGFRTANPYGDDEVVDVSVRGKVRATDFQASVMRDIEAGPDE